MGRGVVDGCVVGCVVVSSDVVGGGVVSGGVVGSDVVGGSVVGGGVVSGGVVSGGVVAVREKNRERESNDTGWFISIMSIHIEMQKFDWKLTQMLKCILAALLFTQVAILAYH